MASDWFRNTMWSAAIEADFFARLARARKAGRAQYLRIQALTLASPDAGDSQLRVALRLLGMVFEQYPERSQLAVAHEAAGRCYELLGETDAAVAAYVKSVEVQAEGRGPLGDAAYALAPLCIATEQWELLERAMASLSTERNRPTLAYQLYVYNAACAALAFRNRDPNARSLALAAREAAAAQHSGFSRHPDVGLVIKRHPILEEQLEMVLAS